MKSKRERKPTRLKGFDYSTLGIYFVTICTYQRNNLFGDVVDGIMQLNSAGKIVKETWEALPSHYPYIDVNHYVIMPNHVHGVIELLEEVGEGFKPSPTSHLLGLSEIVRGFKTFSAKRVNILRKSVGNPVWQRSFYDRIIRKEEQHHAAIHYIQDNPRKWEEDKDNIW